MPNDRGLPAGDAESPVLSPPQGPYDPVDNADVDL